MSGFAIVRVHPDSTCVVSFYNRDGLDAFATEIVEIVPSVEAATARWPGYVWRTPTEAEERRNRGAVLIGE